MIAEIGHYALVLALMIALVQASVPLIGAQRNDPALMALAQPTAIVQALFIATAFLSLTYAFVVSDFSVANVVENSHSAKPLIYKISGVWGNHEGSMLLWVLILSVFGGAVAVFGDNLPSRLRARVLSVQGMIGAGFLAFVLFTSNPFERIYPPAADGNGLNPLLQDPGLAIHPPFLYLGYVGFSIAFAFAVAALIGGQVDAAWARWVRPWTLAAWCCLTAGIALGSLWAYYELGWGGWWYWDPVENASFMPWLLGTALLHSAIVVEKRDALKSWTILLAILTFSLSMVGTFVVRSGVLTSVHAFALDPSRGVFILVLLVVATGGALLLYALRARSLKMGGLFSPVSREGSLVLNNMLLVSATATVFLGTFYPLFVDAFGNDKISVGPPYFNLTFVPLIIPLLIAMAVGPFLGWKRGNLMGVLFRLKATLIASCIVVILAAWLTWGRGAFALIGLFIAAWLFFGTLHGLIERLKLCRISLVDSWSRARHLPRSHYGMFVAHAGIAVMVAGVTGVSAWQEEDILVIKLGDSARISGYDVALESVTEGNGPNYQTTRGVFRITRDGQLIDILVSEKRFYPIRRMDTTEAGIRTNLFENLYVVLGDPDGRGGWAVRLYHHPLVPWIWIGALVMVAGGGLSLSDRRYRVGAPNRSKTRVQAPAMAPAE